MSDILQRVLKKVGLAGLSSEHVDKYLIYQPMHPRNRQFLRERLQMFHTTDWDNTQYVLVFHIYILVCHKTINGLWQWTIH